LPAESLAVTVKASVPAAVGVPLIVKLPVPLAGTVNPLIAEVTFTVSFTVPVPPLAVITWS